MFCGSFRDSKQGHRNDRRKAAAYSNYRYVYSFRILIAGIGLGCDVVMVVRWLRSKMDGSGTLWASGASGRERFRKRKAKRDKAGDRQAMFVRQSEPAESRRAATSTSRVGFSLSSYIEKTKPRTMIRSLLAVVGMATMAGEFVVGFGCGFIWMAARYFGRNTAADSAGDGNNPLVV